MAEMGRPSKFTPKIKKKLIEALNAGATHELAARYAGIGRSTFYDWKARAEAGDPGFADFLDVIEDAEAVGAVELLKTIKAAAADPKEWRAALAILERRYPETYGKQRVEHTGKDGGPLDVTFRIVWTDEDDNSGHG